jgi:hypothetical protein
LRTQPFLKNEARHSTSIGLERAGISIAKSTSTGKEPAPSHRRWNLDSV